MNKFAVFLAAFMVFSAVFLVFQVSAIVAFPLAFGGGLFMLWLLRDDL